MADYKLHYNGSSVIRNVDGAVIPFDAGNKDYLTYLDWTKTGKIADAADPNPFIQVEQPQPTIEELQAKLLELQAQIKALS
jgi:hypothetical protein